MNMEIEDELLLIAFLLNADKFRETNLQNRNFLEYDTKYKFKDL